VYFRFVDDVWGLWTHGRDALLDFHTKGNQINPRIQLELSYSTEQLEFLDTMTSLQGGSLHTDRLGYTYMYCIDIIIEQEVLR